MNRARITHATCPYLSPEEARDHRARAWKFIFDAFRAKSAAQSSQFQTRKEATDETLRK